MYLFFQILYLWHENFVSVCFGNVQENITFIFRSNSDIGFVCVCFGNVQEHHPLDLE